MPSPVRKHPSIRCPQCPNEYSTLYLPQHLRKVHGVRARAYRKDRTKPIEPSVMRDEPIAAIASNGQLTPFDVIAETKITDEAYHVNEELLARAIINKVIDHARNPITIEVDNPRLLENIDKLQQVIFDLSEENEKLKKEVQSLKRTPRYSDGVTTRIKELLPEDEWKKLMEAPKNHA